MRIGADWGGVPEQRLAALSVVLTTAASLYLLAILDTTTLRLVFFTTPVLVAAAPLAFRRRRQAIVARAICGALLSVLVLFLAFGGGIFYLPGAGTMIAAAVLPARVDADDDVPWNPPTAE